MTATVVPPAVSGRVVGSAIDADREPAHDRRPGPDERRRDARGDRPPSLGRSPRPDDRDRVAAPRGPPRRRARTAGAVAGRSSRADRDTPASSTVTTDRPRPRIRSSVASPRSAASAIAVARAVETGRRRASSVRGSMTVAVPDAASEPDPSGPAATRRTSRPLPNRARRAAKPDRAQPVDAGEDRPGVPFRLSWVRSARLDDALGQRSGCTHAEHLRPPCAVMARDSDERNQAASSRCSTVTASASARSAIVRATRRSRSTPRPLARSSSARDWT